MSKGRRLRDAREEGVPVAEGEVDGIPNGESSEPVLGDEREVTQEQLNEVTLPQPTPFTVASGVVTDEAGTPIVQLVFHTVTGATALFMSGEVAAQVASNINEQAMVARSMERSRSKLQVARSIPAEDAELRSQQAAEAILKGHVPHG
jgi:hypothetical protein